MSTPYRIPWTRSSVELWAENCTLRAGRIKDALQQGPDALVNADLGLLDQAIRDAEILIRDLKYLADGIAQR